jgi:hypothetical protein
MRPSLGPPTGSKAKEAPCSMKHAKQMIDTTKMVLTTSRCVERRCEEEVLILDECKFRK